MSDVLLSVEGLTTGFETPAGLIRAVDDVSYSVRSGETLGIVGESGSGKTVTVMSMLGLLRSPPARILAGRVWFQGSDLLSLSQKELRKIRGRYIGMVFQDPMKSLNPVLTVGYQIAEALRAHGKLTKNHARDRSIGLLDLVGVPNPNQRFDQYPHQYSGGMRQRAMIAMAIANEPKLLIADEPTTALDVTIQAQVLDLLQRAKEETQAATILITHDLGLIAEMADRVVVMYGGRVVEYGDVESIFHHPRHPYTVGLMSSLPRRNVEVDRLSPIAGSPPSPADLPAGCAFHPRCSLQRGRKPCYLVVPPLAIVEGSDHQSACHFADEVESQTWRVAEGTDPPTKCEP